ncbi:MAG: NF038143 family protein [Desulfohalobiaceae bacterium]
MGNQNSSKKYRDISQEELHFVRTLATHIRAKTPQPFWHWLIPFKFALEMLAKSRMTDELSKNVFQARQLALDSAYALQEGKDRTSVLQDLEANLQKWLQGQNLYTQDILDKQLQLAEQFMEHYCRLFKAQGRGYQELVRNAYLQPQAYQDVLQRISDLEKDIDQEVLQIADSRVSDSSKLEQNIQAKQEALQETRAREVRRIFK